MATFNTPIITNQGLEFLKSAVAGHDRLIFSNIVFSAQDLSNASDDDIAKMDDLTDKDMVNAPTTMRDKLTGELKIRSVGYNNSTSQAFYIRTYGLYATNQAGKELLIAVAIAQEPDFVPANNGKQVNQLTYTFNFNLSSTNNIQFSDEHDIGVTQADLDNIKTAVIDAQSAVKNIDLSGAVKQANSYTDKSINSYATTNQSQMSSALSSAGSVAVNNATNALSSANSYTDSKTADATQNANGYTDTAIKNLGIDDKLKNAGFSYKGELTSNDDLNNIFEAGMYYVYAEAKNNPTNDYGILLVYNAYDYCTQEFIDTESYVHYERVNADEIADEWSNWVKIANSSDLSYYAKASDLDNYAKASDLSNYATNNELLNYVGENELISKLSNYAKTSDLNNYAKASDLSNYAKASDLSNYATNNELLNYVGENELISKLLNYAKASDLSNYAKASDTFTFKGELNQNDDLNNINQSGFYYFWGAKNAPSNHESILIVYRANGLICQEVFDTNTQYSYVRTGYFTSINSSWTRLATTDDLPDTSKFATTEQLADKADKSALSGYATTAQLSGYAKQSDLSGYAKTSQLPNMSNYATTEQLSSYATNNQLSSYAKASDLSSYATTTDLSSKANKSDLSDYAKVSQLPDLSGYAKTSQLPDMSGYAKTSQLPDMSGYAKQQDFNNTIHFVRRLSSGEDLTKIRQTGIYELNGASNLNNQPPASVGYDGWGYGFMEAYNFGGAVKAIFHSDFSQVAFETNDITNPKNPWIKLATTAQIDDLQNKINDLSNRLSKLGG